jgi:8-oxo-dGTP pyrophosphatase MutT (NUDIX family)
MEDRLNWLTICMTDMITCSGALFYTLDTNRFLFLHRANGKRNNMWGLVGGTNEAAETPFEGLKREIEEEIGFLPDIKKTLPLESFLSADSKFYFHTYLCVIHCEFIPILNNEHDGYAWCSFTKWPKPLHHGLRNTLQSRVNLNKLETVFQTINLLDK